jgi:hypothetical protein
MSTPNTYTYQPDPEIWSGGATTGLFTVTSGPDYSEKIFRKYDSEITPGSSATGLISVSGSISAEHSLKKYVGEVSAYLISNSAAKSVIYIPPINKKLINNYLGSTNLTFDNTNITFDNTNITFDNNNNNKTSDIVVTGSALTHVISNVPEEIVTVGLSIFSTEKTGHSYNESSSGSFSTENYSTINESITSSVDYGELISTPSQGDEDFGFVFNSGSSIIPFGSITISGSAIVIDPPGIKTYDTGANYRVVYNPPENIVDLLSSGEKIESVSYGYNKDSINLIVQENNGLITGSVTEIDDSGLVSEPVVGASDYQGIEITSTNTPFGTLSLNGSATTEYNNLNFYPTFALVKVVYSPDETTGTLFNFGNIAENVTYSYNINSSVEFIIDDLGSITGSYETNIENYGFIGELPTAFEELGPIEVTSASNPFGTLNIGGSANTVYVDTNFYDNITTGKIKVSYSPDNTTGILFSFGDKSESVTYNYNLSSANLLVIEDSGLITDSPTQVVDDGLINSLISGQDSYGDLYLTSSQTPFGTTVISGSADVIYINANFYDNITTSKVRVAYSPDNTTGTLFSFGDKSESVTHNYNNDSILTFVVDNFGLVSNSSTETNDYGYVNEAYGEQIDNGLDTGLGQSETITPFGNLSISGSSETVLLTYGQENTILFTIFGELNSPNIDYTPAISGIGTAYISGSSNNAFVRSSVVIENILVSETGIESRTHSYNENSIVLNVTPSYGLISESTTESGDDYGTIVGSSGETEDYGLTSVGIQSAYPYGTIIISGTPLIHPEVDYTPKYTGVGTFNISGSADYSETDAFGVGRRRGGNINFFGNALYSENDIYIGIGTIVLDREGVVVPGLIARTRTYVGIETIILSSTSLLSEIDVYIGSGLISISGSVIEKTTSDTPDNTQLFSIYGELNHPDIDYTPHYGIEKNIGIGTTGIQITEQTSAVEKFVANTPENTQLFQIYGSGIESVGFNSPEDTELFVISGASIESKSESYVGVGGTLTLSDFGVEKNTESYVGVGTLQVSGVVDDSAQRTSRGVGSIFIVNGFSPQESYPWLPEPGVGRSWSFARTTYIAQTPLINISSGIALTHYYSPIYPRNALITDPSSGIGTIRINDDNEITLYRATLPYFARGTIFLSGIGPESFTESTFVGSGTLTFSGISSNREIAVYQDYVTGGVITISQQTDGIIEKNTESYFGSGTILVSQSLLESNTESYFGSGTILGLSGDSEAYSAQTPEETVTITVSGSAQESFIAQTPEDTILYQFSGNVTDEKLVKAYSGSGLVNVNGSATVTSRPAHLASGTIRFVKYTSDQNYDTCDSVDITSDNLYSANVSFVVNPSENTILFDIDGNAITSETALYTKVAVGLYALSGTYQNIKLTHSESGIGAVFIAAASSQSERDVYIGSGGLFALSGRSESYSAQTPESTVILQISGSAITSLESDYSSVGIGIFTFNGSSITSKIASYTQVGSGIITLSGQLVYPDIIFIPSPDGSGTINIFGSSNNSLTKIYQTSGSLFQFASAFKSFTKSAYTGLGTIYIEQTSSITINNPYQIPRVYTTII